MRIYIDGAMMFTYLIMRTPGYNRVYYHESLKMAIAELTLATARFQSSVENIEGITLGDIDYIQCILTEEIREEEIGILSRLSFIFALFEQKRVNHIDYLRPIKKELYNYLDSKVSSLLKYPGKTNELFTKMMLNVALLSSDFGYNHCIKLLDPVAGRGTTLFEGAVYGFDGYGIELNKKSVHDGVVFFKKYLERERHKHTQVGGKIAGEGKKDQVQMETFEYALNKDQFKNGDKKILRMINGDTTKTDQLIKKDSIHLIVGDLPYGVAHGNIGKGTKSRNPMGLLEEALPKWKRVLKSGGIVVLGWNVHLFSVTQMRALFCLNGLTVLDDQLYSQFEHRVDHSIQRNIIVAKQE